MSRLKKDTLHRLTQKTEELWLSWWKLSGPVMMTRYMQIPHHCEAISQVQKQSVVLIAKMEKEGLKILPPNWDKSTMLTFLYIKNIDYPSKRLNPITVSALSKFPCRYYILAHANTCRNTYDCMLFFFH